MNGRDDYRARRLEGGFYLHKVFVDPKDFRPIDGITFLPKTTVEKAVGLVRSKAAIENAAHVPMSIGSAVVNAFSIGALASHTSPEVQKFNNIRQIHKHYIMADRINLIFVPDNEFRAGMHDPTKVGDPIAQLHAKGYSGFNIAAAWVLSANPLSELKLSRNMTNVTMSQCIVFFSKQNALNFYQKIRKYQLQDVFRNEKPFILSYPEWNERISVLDERAWKIYNLSKEFTNYLDKKSLRAFNAIAQSIYNPDELSELKDRLENYNNAINKLISNLKRLCAQYVSESNLEYASEIALLITTISSDHNMNRELKHAFKIELSETPNLLTSEINNTLGLLKSLIEKEVGKDTHLEGTISMTTIINELIELSDQISFGESYQLPNTNFDILCGNYNSHMNLLIDSLVALHGQLIRENKQDLAENINRFIHALSVELNPGHELMPMNAREVKSKKSIFGLSGMFQSSESEVDIKQKNEEKGKEKESRPGNS